MFEWSATVTHTGKNLLSIWQAGRTVEEYPQGSGKDEVVVIEDGVQSPGRNAPEAVFALVQDVLGEFMTKQHFE